MKPIVYVKFHPATFGCNTSLMFIFVPLKSILYFQIQMHHVR